MASTPASPPADGARLAQALLQPRSIALVGATDEVGAGAGRTLQSLRAGGFGGRVYPVHPGLAKVQGERAWPDLGSLPEVPDQVLVLPAGAPVLETVRDAAARGVPVVTVLAGGFTDAPTADTRDVQALREAARATGVRVLGPGSHGLVHVGTRLVLSPHPAFAGKLPPGAVFVACHGGGMIPSLVERGAARGVGFAGFVSTGAEADLSIGEVCAATLDDLAVEGYLLFLDHLRNGLALGAFCREAAARGKPVVACKMVPVAPPATAPAEGAQRQIGALATEEDVADAFLAGVGVVRVRLLETLLDAFPLASRLLAATEGAPPRRIGVVSTSPAGGPKVLEHLAGCGLAVQPASEDTLGKLADLGIAVAPDPVLDLSGMRKELLKRALAVVLEAEEFDLVLAVLGSPGRFGPPLDVKPVIEAAAGARAFAVVLYPESTEALAELTRGGVPCFRSPETCADAVSAVLARRAPGPQPPASHPRGPQASALADAQVDALLDALRIARAPTVAMRLSQPPTALPFAFPVSARLGLPRAPQQHDPGALVSGIRDGAELAAAFAALRRHLATRAGADAGDEVLVQPARKGLTEVMLGYRVHPEAGPLVMLAAGGAWADVARDRSLRLAPVTLETARAMVAQVQALRSVAGTGGKPAGDLEALARAIAAFSLIAMKPEWRITEAEVSRLLVLPQGEGVLALDALVLRA